MTNLPLMTARRNDAAAKLDKAVARRDDALAALCREQGKLADLRRKLARLDARLAKAGAEHQTVKTTEAIKMDGQPTAMKSVPAVPTAAPPVANAAPEPAAAPAADDKLDIPGFLRRRSPLDATAQAIQDEQDGRRKAKSRGRIATMKAKQAGDLRRMPLQGRAALAAIRGTDAG